MPRLFYTNKFLLKIVVNFCLNFAKKNNFPQRGWGLNLIPGSFIMDRSSTVFFYLFFSRKSWWLRLRLRVLVRYSKYQTTTLFVTYCANFKYQDGCFHSLEWDCSYGNLFYSRIQLIKSCVICYLFVSDSSLKLYWFQYKLGWRSLSWFQMHLNSFFTKS